jgi:hypothetical protein
MFLVWDVWLGIVGLLVLLSIQRHRKPPIFLYLTSLQPLNLILMLHTHIRYWCNLCPTTNDMRKEQ